MVRRLNFRKTHPHTCVREYKDNKKEFRAGTASTLRIKHHIWAEKESNLPRPAIDQFFYREPPLPFGHLPFLFLSLSPSPRLAHPSTKRLSTKRHKASGASEGGAWGATRG